MTNDDARYILRCYAMGKNVKEILFNYDSYSIYCELVLDSISPANRQLILLKYVLNFSYRELSNMLYYSERQIRRLVDNALKEFVSVCDSYNK